MMASSTQRSSRFGKEYSSINMDRGSNYAQPSKSFANRGADFLKNQTDSIMKSHFMAIWVGDVVTKSITEFGGVLMLVFFLGLVIHADYGTVPVIALTYGAITTMLNFVFSNQFFNPFLALQSCMFCFARGERPGMSAKMWDLTALLWTWGLQFSGSIAAASALRYFFDDMSKTGLSIPPPGMTDGKVLAMEFAGAFLYSILHSCAESMLFAQPSDELSSREERTLRRVVVQASVSGLAIGVVTIAIYPFTGASVNFARSIGPAIISKEYRQLGLIFAGQAIGYFGASVMFNARYLMKKWNYMGTKSVS